MKTILAKPLLLVPLSTQITELGGQGYNSDVETTRVKGSFSSLYRFKTPEGERTLLTRNEFQVGFVNNQFIMYHGDLGEFTLVTRNTFSKFPFKLLHVQTLGFSFDDMKKQLSIIFPKQIVWNLTDPATANG